MSVILPSSLTVNSVPPQPQMKDCDQYESPFM